MKRKEKGGEGSVICRKESTCLWRVSVQDFQLWQKHFSLTVIARGHLWCSHSTDRGDFGVKREMLRFPVDYRRNVCMLCVGSLINWWMGKLGKWLISVTRYNNFLQRNLLRIFKIITWTFQPKKEMFSLSCSYKYDFFLTWNTNSKKMYCTTCTVMWCCA